jgi:hypothetical protein
MSELSYHGLKIKHISEMVYTNNNVYEKFGKKYLKYNIISLIPNLFV